MSDLIPSARFMFTILLVRILPIIILGLMMFSCYTMGVHDAKKVCDCEKKGGQLLKDKCVQEVKP